MSTNNTYNVLIIGPTKASKAALTLVNRGWWFSLEPYPNEHWMLTVKKESGPLAVLRELEIPGPANNSNPRV